MNWVRDGFEESVRVRLGIPIVTARLGPGAGDAPVGFKYKVGLHIGIELGPEASDPDQGIGLVVEALIGDVFVIKVMLIGQLGDARLQGEFNGVPSQIIRAVELLRAEE